MKIFAIMALLSINSYALVIPNPTLSLKDQTNEWEDRFQDYQIDCSSDVSSLCEELTDGELTLESEVECKAFLKNPSTLIKILPSRRSKFEKQIKSFKTERLEYQTIHDPWWEKAYIESGKIREAITSIDCQ